MNAFNIIFILLYYSLIHNALFLFVYKMHNFHVQFIIEKMTLSIGWNI